LTSGIMITAKDHVTRRRNKAHLFEGAAAVEVVLLHNGSELLLRHDLALSVPAGVVGAAWRAGERRWIRPPFQGTLIGIEEDLAGQSIYKCPFRGRKGPWHKAQGEAASEEISVRRQEG
jgi:hypothetical protein